LPFESLDQYQQRKKKLKEIEALGFDPYPHKYHRTHTAGDLVSSYGTRTARELESGRVAVRVAGRILTLRTHGKAGFAHILDGGHRLQIYVKVDAVGQRQFELFRLLDLGDCIGVSGHLFRTKTNELTVWVEQLVLLAKALLPLPEKWHGLADVEQRYRRRYVDLIVNPQVREVFVRRAQIIREMRRFFDARGYIEVETPMMQLIAGGATARPFTTRHNALDLQLYLRIAPELFLKRLVVGGMDRVYEINRNFRNEGISTQHNPEFTMLEFYQAYSDYQDLMSLTEELLTGLVKTVCGTSSIRYGEHVVEFSSWQRLSMREAVCRYWPEDAGLRPTVPELASPCAPSACVERYNRWAAVKGTEPIPVASGLLHKPEADGVLTGALFEAVAADKLIQPTLVYDFPVELSPLSKVRDDDSRLAERFEIFAGGLELGNAYSELNDAEEQERRFREQVARGGEQVAKEVDLDYIRALCVGLPPAAGEGIGIDRLTMLLTDSHSIREVILFPLLRPESPETPNGPLPSGPARNP